VNCTSDPKTPDTCIPCQRSRKACILVRALVFLTIVLYANVFYSPKRS
jgi:hypothetical protein